MIAPILFKARENFVYACYAKSISISSSFSFSLFSHIRSKERTKCRWKWIDYEPNPTCQDLVFIHFHRNDQSERNLKFCNLWWLLRFLWITFWFADSFSSTQYIYNVYSFWIWQISSGWRINLGQAGVSGISHNGFGVSEVQPKAGFGERQC